MGTTTYCSTRSIGKGFHDIKMEYYENGGGAYSQLWWNILGSETALGGSGLRPNDDIGNEEDIMALYNDHGYLGPLVEEDIQNISYPRVLYQSFPNNLWTLKSRNSPLL